MENQGFVRVSQTADDIYHDTFPVDGLPSRDDTMEAIAAYTESKSTTKYGAGKSALFPTAEQIAEIKAFLETLPGSEEARSFCPKSLIGEGNGEEAAKKNGSSDSAAQWRFGTKSKYHLDDFGIVFATGENKGGYMVPREHVHDVLVWAHRQTGHGGRDKMYAEIKKHYCESSFPKAFINDWSFGCTHRICQKKPRGAKNGPAPTPKRRATAQKQTVTGEQVENRHAAIAAPVPVVDAPAHPAYSLQQTVPDPETISGWDDAGVWSKWMTAAAKGLPIPKEFQGLFTEEDLVGWESMPESAEGPSMAVDAEGDLEFDMSQYLGFSA
ncbi:hypothetical protein MMC27_003227 [Xylographa pallens]|nr:hypothetical protein [Xylographa pallens]